tara:strand:- start:243 stop:476 length:234 start_codon:yes stop_codon:yes gene_type:complete
MKEDNFVAKDMIDEEYFEGRYFSDDTAVNVDYQNGKTNVIAYCICKNTAKDLAKSLNLLDNLEDGVEFKNDNKKNTK